MNSTRMSHYYPAFFIAFLGFFFSVFPSLAAFLVIFGLFGFAGLYAFIIFRFHRYYDAVKAAEARGSSATDAGDDSHQPGQGQHQSGKPADDFHDFDGDLSQPSFSHVTVFLTKRGKRLKDFRF